MEQRQMQKSIPLYTLIILVSFASVASVLFTPGLPQLQHQFQISTASTQLTVSLFLLGYTIGPLIYAPLANRYGRKNTLYAGISVAFISSLLCALAPFIGGFTVFLVARFLSALGASAGLTIAFTLISDVFTDRQERGRVIAYSTLAFAIMPGLAIYVGGLLVSYWNWPSCFYFYMIYCALVAFLVSRLPETKPMHTEAVSLKKMLCDYYQVARSGKLWIYSIIWGITTGIIFTFSAIAPIVGAKLFNLSADAFGTYSLCVFTGLAVGNILSAKLVTWFSLRKIIIAGIIVSLSSAILLFLTTLSGHLSVVSLFLWTTLLFLGLPAIFCNALALATEQSSDTAIASSLITSIDLLVAIIVLSLMGLMIYSLAATMSGLFVVMMITIALLFYWVRRR